MDIAVIGGRGFVGEAVTEQLREEHDVTTMDPKVGGTGHVSVDITDAEMLVEVLDGFDAVVNLVGLTPMKEPRGVSYEDIHVDGAENVAAACEENGIDRLVHMSALGADPEADTAYLRTKGEGRDIVLDSGLDVTVFEPSIIFDTGNELVGMAASSAWTRMFPYLRTRIQPVYRGDMAELFRQAVAGGIDEEVVRCGGPDRMTLFDLVKKIYNAMGYRCIPVPMQPLIKLVLYLAEPLPFVPYGADQARFLSFDNTVEGNDAADYVELTSVAEWLAAEYGGS